MIDNVSPSHTSNSSFKSIWQHLRLAFHFDTVSILCLSATFRKPPEPQKKMILQPLQVSLLLALAKVSWTMPHQSSPADAASGRNLLHVRDNIQDSIDLQKLGPCRWEDAHEPTQDWYYRSQVTRNIACASAEGCATTKTEAQSFGWSVDVGVNTPYTSAGFSVTQEWSSGEEYQCDGAEGDIVCVWVKVPYLQYNVKAAGYCNPDQTRATFKSPKAEGGNYYCVTGSACRGLGQGYWNQDVD